MMQFQENLTNISHTFKRKKKSSSTGIMNVSATSVIGNYLKAYRILESVRSCECVFSDLLLIFICIFARPFFINYSRRRPATTYVNRVEQTDHQIVGHELQ